MKKAFTLIEMLIVVAILATLMTVVFRIASIGDNEKRRIQTVTALQKLENCLSGYYAAFGSYPQVQLYGSRDIGLEIEGGVQTESRNEVIDDAHYSQIDAACRAQPVAANCPFPNSMHDAVLDFSEEIQARFRNPSDYPAYQKVSEDMKEVFTRGFSIGSPSLLSSYRNEVEWRKVQIFRFGLMSFLLPRYIVMMDCDPGYFGSGGNAFAQWDKNNDLPCRACTGTRYSTWSDIQRDVQPDSQVLVQQQFIEVANIPSQAACARWMPNLERLCCSSLTRQVFGVDIGYSDGLFQLEDDRAPNLPVYSPGRNKSAFYLLNNITVQDGWRNDFYYYSPDGFQSYALWSAGANGKTFPPWVDRAKLNTSEREYATKWVSDDIIRMKD